MNYIDAVSNETAKSGKPKGLHVPQTLFDEYRELAAAEHNAEGLALDIGRALRDNVHIDKDGNLTGRPSSADLRREAEAWARVASLRAGRYRWIEAHA